MNDTLNTFLQDEWISTETKAVTYHLFTFDDDDYVIFKNETHLHSGKSIISLILYLVKELELKDSAFSDRGKHHPLYTASANTEDPETSLASKVALLKDPDNLLNWKAQYIEKYCA